MYDHQFDVYHTQQGFHCKGWWALGSYSDVHHICQSYLQLDDSTLYEGQPYAVHDFLVEIHESQVIDDTEPCFCRLGDNNLDTKLASQDTILRQSGAKALLTIVFLPKLFSHHAVAALFH